MSSDMDSGERANPPNMSMNLTGKGGVGEGAAAANGPHTRIMSYTEEVS